MKTPLVVALAAYILGARVMAEDAPIGIPMKPDPPPAVDGQLEEWSNVPGVMVLNRREQATWGGAQWKSPADLSAKVWLAWRQDMLYLAADVTDDKLRQTERGAGIWKGDCIQLLLDIAPDEESARTHFGKGQFQIAFSPGNFQHAGDALADCPPEAYCFKPAGLALKGALVAAQQTDHGYTLEAAIPWSLFGVTRPAAGMPVGFEIAVFDTDGAEPRPEKLLSFSTKPWAVTRARLNYAVLAGADGKAPAITRGAPVFGKVELKRGEKQTFKFTAARPPAGKEAVLALQARMDMPKVAGYTHALKLTLNGTTLDGKRLMNKPLETKGRDGRIHRLVAANCFTTYYAPDFTSADTSSYAIPGIKTGDFELRISDLLREGENQLVLENACSPNVSRPLVVANGRVNFAAPPPPPKPKAGPPAGAIPVCAPAKETKGNYDLRELPDAKLVVGIGGEQFTIESRFSTPAGKWERGSNAFFEHSRQIERKDGAIVVHDTFKNLTRENLPLMQRHETITSSSPPIKKLWLAGLSPAAPVGSSLEPANPTTFGVTEKTGIGLLPLNDEFQVHVSNYAADGSLGLADNQFVLQPGKSYTAEWAIVPVARPDYFEFVNAARRLLDANFTIPFCFAFLRGGPLTEKWTDEQFTNFIKFKSATMVCNNITYPMYQGHYTQGIAFQLVSHDSYKRYAERVRRLAPGTKSGVYFHCFIDAEQDAAAKFPDACVLRSDGSHADYGEACYGIFFPTETNAFGRAIRRNVDMILDEIKADGVYWDELEYSAYQYHFGEPWDGCSADIDAKTMKVRRLKSSVTLLSQPWRIGLIKEIMARGPFIANGQPHTRTIARLKFPRFCETGSISNCALAQLHSPIALGDHLTERSEADAYRNMLAALDYGCVSHWYSDMQVIPAYETLAKFMYPITPVELHEGYIIGKERILTNRSGLFGWGDRSAREVHVFDDTGREVPDFKAPTVERDGALFTELRIGEGWSAAMVRKSEAK
jgi:Carbohydrate family 9 binding domain-like